MDIILDQHTLPEQGTVQLHIDRTFEIKLTAKEARRKVNLWVLLEVSCVMGAMSPSLVVGERIVWRVPVELTASHIGHVGVAGFVDVDVQTGEMDVSPARVVELQTAAMAFAEKIPPYTPRKDVPVEYLATHIQPTHPKPIPDPQFVQAVADALLRLTDEA